MLLPLFKHGTGGEPPNKAWYHIVAEFNQTLQHRKPTDDVGVCCYTSSTGVHVASDLLMLAFLVQEVAVQLKQQHNCAPVFIAPDVRDKYYKGVAGRGSVIKHRLGFWLQLYFVKPPATPLFRISKSARRGGAAYFV